MATEVAGYRRASWVEDGSEQELPRRLRLHRDLGRARAVAGRRGDHLPGQRNPLFPDAPIEADVDGTTRVVSTPLSAWLMLDDYESILLGDAMTDTVDNVLAVWAELTEG